MYLSLEALPFMFDEVGLPNGPKIRQHNIRGTDIHGRNVNALRLETELTSVATKANWWALCLLTIEFLVMRL